MATESLTLPDMCQSLLDSASLEALFDDYQKAADVHEIRARSSSRALNTEVVSDLIQALSLLQQKATFGLQVFYRFDGHEWTDTLIPSPQGVRIVRIKALEIPPVH